MESLIAIYIKNILFLITFPLFTYQIVLYIITEISRLKAWGWGELLIFCSRLIQLDL